MFLENDQTKRVNKEVETKSSSKWKRKMKKEDQKIWSEANKSLYRSK